MTEPMTMPRVKIDRLSYADAEEILGVNEASKDYHAPWASPVLDMAGFDQWYGQMIAGPNLSFVIRELDGNAIAGVATLSQIVWGVFRSAYLGYYGAAALSRRGYMREGLALVIDHAFYEIGLHRLEANIQPGNVASLRLVESLGFSKEGYSRAYLKLDGIWRDHERWALLNEKAT